MVARSRLCASGIPNATLLRTNVGRAHLKPSVPDEEIDGSINDEALAGRAADLLLNMIKKFQDRESDRR